MANSENRRIVREVARLVDAAREREPAYASRSWVPAGTWQMADLMKAFDCHVSYWNLPPGVEGMAMPPLAGTNPIVVREFGDVERDLQVRHELAHVVAEETAEPMFLNGEAFGWSERVCDTFALADLVSGAEIRRMRHRRTLWEALEEIAVHVRSWAPGWPEDRVRDRALLRMMLWRLNRI